MPVGRGLGTHGKQPVQEEQRKDVDIGRTVPPPRAAAPAPPNKDIGADDAVLDEEIAAFLARGG